MAQATFSTEAETLGHVLGLIEAFRAFDSDNDGRITQPELTGVMGSLGYNLSDQDVRAIMDQHDQDHDGLLTLTEFLEFNTKDMDLGDMARFLRAAVQTLDMDSDDVVTGDELFEVIRENGMALPLAACEEIIGSMDVDGDGGVSFEDFQIVVNALL